MFKYASIILAILLLENALCNPTNKERKSGTKEQIWCDPILGCLDLDDTWYTPSRPINEVPDTRESINTRFYLHTKAAPNEALDYVVSADDLTSLDNSPFDPTKPTKFISHGFIDKGTTAWLTELALAFLQYEDCNVFRIDWGDGSMPMYARAVANTRVVGLEIGHLVNTLVAQRGLDPANVHCAGHSLGSHVCGYGGEQVPGMGRISGLDPAGPYYTGTAPHVRLDDTDAIFVDNIHTDADSILLLGYGTGQPMGNVDIYPNSGHDQPGCDPVSIGIELLTPGDLIGATRDTFACSHCRAVDLFIQATLAGESCKWVAQECYDYDSYISGNCYDCGADSSRCTYLGILGDVYTAKERVNAMFFLNTKDKAPFCMQHYDVGILTASTEEVSNPRPESWVMGRITLTVYGEGGTIQEIQISEDHERFDHPGSMRFGFIHEIDVVRALRIEARWDYDDKIVNPGTYCWGAVCNRSLYVKSIVFSPISHYPQDERNVYTVTGCAAGASITEIEDGSTVSFLPSTSCQPVL